ncbi:MAG: DUF3021 domain-containing protein [Clostridiaceae bacterium]|nr:DUF3021 domain-containing protein [Clostridiaceae bacterium]
MSFKAFLKKCIMDFFIITTCVTVAMAILCILLSPTARFGYEAYLSPIIFGFVSLIPSFVTYSRKELSLKQALIRKVLHFIVLEVTLIAFSFMTGLITEITEVFSFAVTVFIVYLAVNLISWWLDSKKAEEINKMLKALQSKEAAM